MNIPVLGPIWEFFTTYILRQAPYMIGFITLLGYALMEANTPEDILAAEIAHPIEED